MTKEHFRKWFFCSLPNCLKRRYKCRKKKFVFELLGIIPIHHLSAKRGATQEKTKRKNQKSEKRVGGLGIALDLDRAFLGWEDLIWQNPLLQKLCFLILLTRGNSREREREGEGGTWIILPNHSLLKDRLAPGIKQAVCAWFKVTKSNTQAHNEGEGLAHTIFGQSQLARLVTDNPQRPATSLWETPHCPRQTPRLVTGRSR